MPRVKRGVPAHKRHKKVLEQTKGQWGTRHRLYRRAHEALMKSLAYAYRDRRNRKRDMRSLWIIRINAAARQAGISYSQFMAALKEHVVALDRKQLAEMAVNDPEGFAALVLQVSAAPGA